MINFILGVVVALVMVFMIALGGFSWAAGKAEEEREDL